MRCPPGNIVRVQRYDAAAAREALERDGAVVFAGCATEDELNKTERLFWDWAQSQYGVDPAEGVQNTEAREMASSEHTMRAGLVSQGGIGQSDFMWAVRRLQGVQRAWRVALGVEDGEELVPSLDGCAITRNFWKVGWDFNGTDPWFHVDQNPHRERTVRVYQGYLNFFTATPETGGTVLVPGSHKMDHHNGTPDTDDYVSLPGPPAKPVQVVLERGDVLLWDSNTVHCNQGVDTSAPPDAVFPGRRPSHPLIRLVAFVSFLPRSLIPPEASKVRRHYVSQGYTGTHHPARPGPESPDPSFWGWYKGRRPYCPPAEGSWVWSMV
eukprot:Sspe_Gene.119435::Locus_115298_Transcript_1_1_Confidence_1.000_Length_1022::g.119435::m.119435